MQMTGDLLAARLHIDQMHCDSAICPAPRAARH
jgi:hypothetical protein